MQGKSEQRAESLEAIKARPYINKVTISETGYTSYVINPNEYNGKFITSIDELDRTLDAILDELKITEFELQRVDVAINTTYDFEYLWKINCYVKELYGLHIGADKDSGTRTFGDDLTKRATTVSTRTYRMQIYDKGIESRGRSPWKSRVEIQLLRVGKDKTIAELIAKIIADLNVLSDYIEELNRRKAQLLYERYVIESAPDYEGRVKSLPDFVSRYADHIYNNTILNGLYKRVHRGSCENWLHRYKQRGRTLTLYTKKDLSGYISIMKKALKEFSKYSTKGRYFAQIELPDLLWHTSGLTGAFSRL